MTKFSSLMLDIKNMSKEDQLFNFISGLQPWTQTELQWQIFWWTIHMGLLLCQMLLKKRSKTSGIRGMTRKEKGMARIRKESL